MRDDKHKPTGCPSLTLHFGPEGRFVEAEDIARNDAPLSRLLSHSAANGHRY